MSNGLKLLPVRYMYPLIVYTCTDSVDFIVGAIFRPWKSGQPDDAGNGEHCGELWEGDLNDNDCNQHYPFICEISKCKLFSPTG